jgi:hypothetical protein
MSTKSRIEDIQNRIWITERCHMNAEKRSRFLELYFHIVLALFALASIGISVLGNAESSNVNESIFTFTSITTLCLSLLIFGFKFGETAANHRACYLALQKLRETGDSAVAENLNSTYIDILAHHPNHTTGDYMRLAVKNVFYGEQQLESPLGRRVIIGLWQRIGYGVAWVFFRTAFLTFAVTPFLLAGYGIYFSSLQSQ